MSYLDQTSRNTPRTIAAVAILHAGLGYLIVSGLAITVFKTPPRITTAEAYPDTAEPPPSRDLPPPQRDTRASQPTKQIVQLPPDILTRTIDLRPIDPPARPNIDPGPVQPVQQDPPKPNLTRAAEPGGARSGWVTSEDYPPGPLREGVTGTVGISVAIGIDGRVQGCEVTKSSGNAQLDESTCRIYARRARFKPALDGEGKPTTARFADRIRWELPL
jgi:protein TonB